MAFRTDYSELTDREATEQYERLTSELLEHPAYRLRGEWTALQRSYEVFGLNVRDLLALLTKVNEDPLLQIELLQNVRPPHGRNTFMRERDRTLHNTLASIGSLVDHTRRHIRSNYGDSAFEVAFTERNASVSETGEAQFARRFRNYLLHVGHAPFGVTGTFATSADATSMAFVWLDRDRLLEAKTVWNAGSRAFLKAQESQINLLQVVRQYVEKMEDLYEWCFEQENVLHHRDREQMNLLVEAINLTLTRGADDGRDRSRIMQRIQDNL